MQFCSFVGLGFCCYFYYVKRFWSIGNFYRITMQFYSFVGLGFYCYFYYVKRFWTTGNQRSINIVYYYYILFINNTSGISIKEGYTPMCAAATE